MATWISTKKCTAMGLDMPHLVWKFCLKGCFSFLDMVRKRKKWTKNNNNNNNKKELDQNQESSPLLRWSLITEWSLIITCDLNAQCCLIIWQVQCVRVYSNFAQPWTYLSCSERRAFAAGAMCMYSSIVYTVHQHGCSVFGVQITNFIY